MNSAPSIELREPALDDAAALAELGATTFCETFPNMYTDEDLQAYLDKVHSPKSIIEELADPGLRYRVLDDGTRLVGYVKIGRLSVPAQSPAPSAIELRQIYLLKSHIGRGLGQRMMRWAESEFERGQHSEVYLSVFSENQRAIDFYHKGGFEKVGEYAYQVGEAVDREFIFCRNRSKIQSPITM